MSERSRRAFETIQEFLGLCKELVPSFKSVALWHRLIHKDRVDDNVKDRCLQAFRIFCTRYNSSLSTNDYPQTAEIRYSANIYINIHGILKKCNDDDKKVVKEYILTISALVSRDEAALNSLVASKPQMPNIDSSTNTGQFLNDMMAKVTSVMGEGDVENPQQAIMKLMSSGIMNDVTSAGEKLKSGELNIQEMFSAMQTMLTTVSMPSPSEDEPVENPTEPIVEEIEN